MPSSTIKARLQGGHFSCQSQLKSSQSSVETALDLQPQRDNQEQQQYVLGVSWIPFTNNLKKDFSCLVLGFLVRWFMFLVGSIASLSGIPSFSHICILRIYILYNILTGIYNLDK